VITHQFAEVQVILAHGIIAPLTPCCAASGKGSANVESGVVCRACYAEMDPMFGDATLLADPQAADRVGTWTTEYPDVIEAVVQTWRAAA